MLLLTTSIWFACWAFVSAHVSSDWSDSSEEWVPLCSRTYLFASSRTAMYFANQVYVDGKQVSTAPLAVPKGSSVVAIKMNNGYKGLIALLLYLRIPVIDRLTCTNSFQANTSWTAPQYNDSKWVPSINLSSSSYLNIIKSIPFSRPFASYWSSPLWCRLYLLCRPTTTTTRAAVTSTTTAAPTTTTTAKSTSVTTTTTAVPTTTAAPTTTSTPATTTSSQGNPGTTPVPPMPPKVDVITGNHNGINAVGGYLTPILQCLFEANPNPFTYGWIKPDGTPVDQSAVTFTNTDPGWFLVTYTPAEPWLSSNAGGYICFANNSLGGGQDSVLVSVAITELFLPQANQAVFQPVTLTATFSILFELAFNCDSAVLYFADGSDSTLDCTVNCITVDFSLGVLTDSADGTSGQLILPDECNNPTEPTGLSYVWVSLNANNNFIVGSGSTVNTNPVSTLQLQAGKAITRIGAKAGVVVSFYFYI